MIVFRELDSSGILPHSPNLMQNASTVQHQRSFHSPVSRHNQSKSSLWTQGQRNRLREEDQIASNLTDQVFHGRSREVGCQNDLYRLTSINRKSVMQLMKTYGKQRNLTEARKVYAELKELIPRDIYIGTALLSMLAKCGALKDAREIFGNLSERNNVSWNALISGYAQHGHFDTALEFFTQMQDEGVSPDIVTFKALLKGCASMGTIQIGEAIHAKLQKLNLLGKDVALDTALLDMYAKCGRLGKAQELFEKLNDRDVVSWNALMAGYVQHGHGDSAMRYFIRMHDEGVSPTSVSYICGLKACGITGSVDMGEEIHEEIKKQGLLETDSVLGNTLVDMYAKCGMLGKARDVLDKLVTRDAVSWNAMITGYAHHGHDVTALECFREMADEGISPNAVTFTCVLKACGSIGSLEMGEQIHGKIRQQRSLEQDIMLGNTLVDLYAKCGVLEKANDVFGEISKRDVVSWNALIGGHAQMGQANSVFYLFQKMIVDGIEPDVVTLLILLNVCSHAGLVKEAQVTFDDICDAFHLTPSSQHYTCLVDLFGRAGCFKNITLVLDRISSTDYLPLFLAILGACRKWVNVDLGKWAFEKIVQLNPKCSPAYICMRNIYNCVGMHEEASKVESWRVQAEAYKLPGYCWWTDPSGNVHSFIAGERSTHPQSTHIYAKIENIEERLLQYGYSQSFSVDNGLYGTCAHTERLAVVCALINTPKRTPIHVTKNMFVCSDCHFATALISKIEDRKIQVKASNQIHIFKDGRCICTEFQHIK